MNLLFEHGKSIVILMLAHKHKKATLARFKNKLVSFKVILEFYGANFAFDATFQSFLALQREMY